MKHVRASITVVHLVALSLGGVALFGTATQAQVAELHHTGVRGDGVKWGAAPPSLPPGAQGAILLGNPSRSCSASGSPPASSSRLTDTRRTSSSP
jgi:hypothetical protein